MILIDANILIYAVNHDAPQHAVARDWLEETLSSTMVVGLPWIVLLAFLRLTTHHRILSKPMRAEQALSYIDGWLAQPFVRLLNPGERHWMILSRLLRNSGTAGNLTSDAHIAAIAIEQGYVVCSADNDYKRFDGLAHVNPLQEVHERGASYTS